MKILVFKNNAEFMTAEDQQKVYESLLNMVTAGVVVLPNYCDYITSVEIEDEYEGEETEE